MTGGGEGEGRKNRSGSSMLPAWTSAETSFPCMFVHLPLFAPPPPLSRTQSVGDKMLSCWLALCLREHVEVGGTRN